MLSIGKEFYNNKNFDDALAKIQEAAKVAQDGYALVPLSLYFLGPYVKVEVGLCKGKKLHDKRDAAAERSAKREIDRAMKERR